MRTINKFPYVVRKKNGIGRKRKGLVTEVSVNFKKNIGKEKFNLSMVAIAKNEGHYIREWVDFHLSYGVEHFLIYDNDSTDDMVEVLQPYVRAGLVTIIPWPWFLKTHNPQSLAYAHALAMLSGVSRWVAFIDIDEFLFPKQQTDLRDALAEFEDEPALAVYWALFGTSGFETRQPGPITQTYTQRLVYPCDAEAPQPYPREIRRNPDTSQIKSIVQPSRVKSTINSHYFKTDRFPVVAVDENQAEIIEGGARQVSFGKFQLNHYFSKSREEFDARLQGRNVYGRSMRDKRERTLELVEMYYITDDYLGRASAPKIEDSVRVFKERR